MDSDDADFREGPSYPSVVKKEKRGKFETPIRKDKKQTAQAKASFFKMKENKYLIKNNPALGESADSSSMGKTEPLKNVDEKEKLKKVSDEGKGNNITKRDKDHKRKVKNINGSLTDKKSLDIRVEKMVKQVKSDDELNFHESSVDDSDEDPDYKVSETTESSSDEDTEFSSDEDTESSSAEDVSEKNKKLSSKTLKQRKLSKYQNGEHRKTGHKTLIDTEDQTYQLTQPNKMPPITQPDRISPITQPDSLTINTSEKQESYVICENCGKRYVNMGSFVKHFKVCKKGHICLRCHQKFKTLKYLKTHMTLQHSENKHTCNDCELRFKSKSKLDSHVKAAHPTVTVKCSICSREFKNANTLRVHKVKCHAKSEVLKKIWQCKWCSKTFKSDRGLRHHKVHHKKLQLLNNENLVPAASVSVMKNTVKEVGQN